MEHSKFSDENILDNELGIDEILESYISREGHPNSLHRPVWDLLDRGGKRFRPLLAYLCCKMFGGNPDKVRKVAAAVELLHNMTLIHDDIEDNSYERRGKPCLHKKYGIPISINVGDAMAVKVFEIILSCEFEPNLKIKIFDKIIKRINEMLYGQALEIENRNETNFEEKVVIDIIKNKTSALIMLASEIGAIMANCNDAQLRILQRFAGYAGLSFQITDDILNLIAEKKYGKEIGGDLIEGKRTIIISHFMLNAFDEDKKKFFHYFGKKDLNKENTIKMLTLLKEYGSIDYAKKMAKYYQNCALFYLQFLPQNNSRETLVKLSKFLTDRNW